MNVALKQYAALLKTLLRNINLNPVKKNRAEKPSTKTKFGKIATVILVIFGAIAIGGYEVMLSVSLTNSVVSGGLNDEHLYAFLFASQIIVFFFGIPAVMSTLYFSRDNALLSTMPFRKGVVFAAKFTVAYLGELLIALIFVIPTTFAAGITASLLGVGIPWYFYPVALIAAFLSPALPLLIITLVSLPLMRVIALLKRNKIGYGIVMTALYCIFFGCYFAMVFGVNFMGGEEGLSNAAITALVTIKKVTVFNYPIVSAMTGVKPVSNFFIFVAGYALIFAVTVIASFFFYGKAINATEEQGGGKSSNSRKAHVQEKQEVPRSLFKAFLFKEFKTLINTPTLLMSAVMSIVLPPIMMIFLRFTLAADDMGEAFGQNGSTMFLIGIITYLVYIISGTSNPISSIGFSREGKNLPFLKSLPISAEVLVKAKLLFSMVISGVFTLILGVAFPFATGVYNPIAIIGMPLLALVSGFGTNCMLLYNDLKNPNYNWMNVNEIARNNRRLIKPMLLNVGIGLGYMILAIVLGMLMENFSQYAVFAIYYCAVLIPPVIISIIYYGKLFADPKGLLDKVGG